MKKIFMRKMKMSISINELSGAWEIRRANIVDCPACGKPYEHEPFQITEYCPECELRIDEAHQAAEKELELQSTQ
jgi:hypothetical protein